MKYRFKRKGFTLIELLLALGVGVIASFVKFQDMRHDQELLQAAAAGEQIQRIGYAVNNYISLRYDKLSTLTPSSNQTSDPGPRNCSGSTCVITIQTLKNEGILPNSYLDNNIFRSSYSIVIKRSGTTPNYILDGLITTDNAWIQSGTNPRYDLLGYAMQKAGIDSGMTKAANKVDGYDGMWSEANTSFSNINKAGQLVFRAGYNANLYSAYLRRDGTLPMTGNLNMGGNDINNAKNITASGTGNFGGDITSGGKITAASEITAHNAYGDAITMGGDAASNDYEIRLGSGKQLTIYSPNAASYSTTLRVNRNTIIDQRLSTNGLDPNDVPSTWAGGIRAYDVLGTGTLAVVQAGSSGASGNWAGYITNNGTIYASNTINSAGTINASGNISGNGIYGNYIHSNGNLDAAGQITSGGRLNANEYIQLNGQVSPGASCSPNGLMGRTPDGTLMSCINGIWSSPTGLKQNACYWVGNSHGRDFTAYSCSVGEYVAGFQFVGHQHSESAYIVKCCK